ncbi:MAG TPA: hypothetical protein VGK01_11930 [Candidatus Angelobacter sp.]|jgi:hypothetical protein
MVNEWLEPELYQTIKDLWAKLTNATVDIRSVQGLDVPLSLAELFATERAAHLPVKVRKMWDALLALSPSAAHIKAPVVYPYASPTEVIFPLSDKACAAAKKHGRGSPKHNAAKRVLHDAMYGEGMNLQSYSEAPILRRREAANAGYEKRPSVTKFETR